MVADALSRITTHLGPESIQVVLDGVTIGVSQRAEEDPAIIEGDQQKEKEVQVTTG